MRTIRKGDHTHDIGGRSDVVVINLMLLVQQKEPFQHGEVMSLRGSHDRDNWGRRR